MKVSVFTMENSRIHYHSDGEYEYGIVYTRYPDSPHRQHLTEAEAKEWIAETVEMGVAAGVFSIIRRPIGDWKVIE